SSFTLARTTYVYTLSLHDALPICLDRCRTRHEALAAGRDRRRDKAQRSREIGDTLLGRAGAGLGGAPIAFLLLKRLLDTFDLCAQEIELARPHRAESLARDAQLLAILKRLLIH